MSDSPEVVKGEGILLFIKERELEPPEITVLFFIIHIFIAIIVLQLS